MAYASPAPHRPGRASRFRAILGLGTAGLALCGMLGNPLPLRAEPLRSPLTAAAQEALPSPQRQAVGPTKEASGAPQWPAQVSAPAGAPNVLLIMTDDVGFGATSTFGGPIPTPTFDRIARLGLRYNQFNTTALCSPTRASLLTGRTPHDAGMGNVTNIPAGYDGYTSVIPKSAGTIAEVLRQNGYNTAMLGKGHITPEWEMSAAGPFDRWPTGLGFEYFYGFLSADSSMFMPSLYEGTKPVEPPHDDPTYHFERDMADHAIRWLRDQHAAAPGKPFFMYYSTGAAHTPHHAPKAWLEKFRGRFDTGWDVMREQTLARQKQMGIVPPSTELTPRPAEMPAWSSLSNDQKIVAARLFESFAAELAYSDDQLGRVIDELDRTGQLANTMIVFIQGDNGGSAEGGLDGEAFEQAQIYGVKDTLEYKLQHLDDIGTANFYDHFPAEWGWAQSAPFQWNKQVASHFGGTRNGMVMAWPGHIPAGGAVRTQFHHVSDIMPTILEAARVPVPATLNGVPQKPLDGISMAYTFDHPTAPSQRRTQVFEMMQNMSIYHDGWIAATTPARVAWNTRQPVPPPAERTWELYDITSDFSEAHNLAAREPRKLEEMKELFWSEAGRTNILPIHGNDDSAGRPTLGNSANPMIYLAPVSRIPENAAPQLIGKSFTIDADVVVPAEGAKGVLVTQGGRYGGYAFYFQDGRLKFHYNQSGPRQYPVSSDVVVTAGRHLLTADYDENPHGPAGSGTVTLKIDGKPVGRGEIVRGRPHWLSHTEGFDVGQETITPINGDYTIATSRFNGTINKVSVLTKK